MFSVFEDTLDGGAAEVAAPAAGGAFADGVVIAVKEEAEVRVKDLIIRYKCFEDHFLEEPGRMGDVPLRRGDVDGRLGDIVFDLEWLAEVFGVLAYAAVRFEQGFGPGRFR